VEEIIIVGFSQRLEVIQVDLLLVGMASHLDPLKEDLGFGLQVDDEVGGRDLSVKELVDLLVKRQFMVVEIDRSKDAVLGEEIVIKTKNRVGIMAEVSAFLASRGINIDAVSGFEIGKAAELLLITNANLAIMDELKKQKFKSGKFTKESLAFSTQETAFAMLIEVSERAMAHCGKKSYCLEAASAATSACRRWQRQCAQKEMQMFVPETSSR
jgi:predicted amino acid-binding ACT domain protein